ncbi:MAG: tRNA (adenine-N1)-methyltransferase [Candidatus Nezhaarchaeales archaeon]
MERGVKVEEVKEGCDALLYLDEKRKYLVKVEVGKVFHTHKGFIRLDEVLGKPYGSTLKSSTGAGFVVLKPTLYDYIYKLPRKTQVMYPKDAGFILVRAGIGPGCLVVEGGSGSGILTCVLANYVKPDGKVYSYEVRSDFLSLARKNVERCGLSSYVEFKCKDITKGIDEEGVDAVVLDLANPWDAVLGSWKALKGGGSFVSFSPTINQVEKTVEALKANKFLDVEAFELMLRPFKVKAGETRPVSTFIAHTGYIVFARKRLT